MAQQSISPAAILKARNHTRAGVPDGLQPFELLQIRLQILASSEDLGIGPAIIYVARDGERMQRMHDILAQLISPKAVKQFPAWDCLPYDRVSPSALVSSQRIEALCALQNAELKGGVLVTTANALMQLNVPPKIIDETSMSCRAGAMVDSEAIVEWAQANGYVRVPNVREPGEFAVRGGLIDLFPAANAAPIRFDFFGKALESIREFDAETQRSAQRLKSINLRPMREIYLTKETIKNFRQAYTSTFGGNTVDDALYAAISAGQNFPGSEHWLPFFYGQLVPLTDFAPNATLVFDDQVDAALNERDAAVIDYYEARKEQGEGADSLGSPYKAINPELLYVRNLTTGQLADQHPTVHFQPFKPSENNLSIVDRKGILPPSFAAERVAQNSNLFESVIKQIGAAQAQGQTTIITCWSEGTRERMAQILRDHDLSNLQLVKSWDEALKIGKSATALIVLELETGFQTDDLFVLSEQDIIGERSVKSSRKRKASDALTEASSLNAGDLVVHIEHGIGRFVGLRAIEVSGAPHDCVEIEYARNDKLYLPVENIELLSRYGEADSDANLDRLGGGAWQAKKAKLKKRIREMAAQLIKIAALRELSNSPPITTPAGLYDEFSARFTFEETQDQLDAIDAVFEDLASGRVMDRLVCGDVGFGKTEVALRAAFAVALTGQQVAVVVPTTLLARQHFKTFSERFAGLPVTVRQMSRLVPAAQRTQTRKELAEGQVDIVVGTHALLAKAIKFKDLSLLIVDEEQHFGVVHKERLKELKSDVHVLTLTATPIPRTLQLALTGVRDLSLLATPPVDRLAIRTFIAPFDALSIREALLREKYRGGQSFYVVPRISDQHTIAEFLSEQVPEVKFVIANGQMGSGELDAIMTDFYDGKFDVLVATSIVESGLDIPNANTMIVHRAEMFGLAQLYQIRGRIGRSKTRAYALFTTPVNKKLTDQAERRLKVLHSLDNLGAGFQLASHDLDIRGAGNLLGDEQSGHIREVGYELYQSMLEEAVAELKSDAEDAEIDTEWSPQISLGLTVMIPEAYVPDLQVRMQLYRQLGNLSAKAEIEDFGAELIDRFGPMPDEVKSLLKISVVKSLCKRANVEKIDAGPKGAILSIRNNDFANPDALIAMVADPKLGVTLKPDQRLVFARSWPAAQDRLKGAASILMRLVKLVE